MRIDWLKLSSKKLTKKDYYTIGGIFGFVLLVFFYVFLSPNYYQKKDPIILDIPKGMGFSQVVDSLFENRIIPNKTNFKIAAFLCGAETRIKAGRYQIPNGLSYIELVNLLLEGQPEKQKLVTIV